MLQWCRGICWNSRCLDFYDQAEIFCRSMGAFLPQTAEVQAFILSSSPLPDPHLRQSLLSSRTNRCFSCCTVCCLIPRRGTVWCVPMQLSALEGISPWVCKEMQLRTTLGFAAALTYWSLGSESQMWSRRNAKCRAPLLDTHFESLGSFNRLRFQMCESPSIFLMVTWAWECYHLNIQDQLRSFKVHMALKKSGVIGGAKASSWFRPGWMPSPSCSTQCACIRRGKLSRRHIRALSGAVMHTWDTAAPGKSLLHLRMALLLPVLPKEKVLPRAGCRHSSLGGHQGPYQLRALQSHSMGKDCHRSLLWPRGDVEGLAKYRISTIVCFAMNFPKQNYKHSKCRVRSC